MKKVYKNIFGSVLPQLVNIISNFILPGLIVLKFGSEINGLVSTTKTIVSYISIIGAGIATAVTQSLYAPVAKKDTEEIKGMLHAANNMFVKYGIIYCVITLVVSFLYPLWVSSDVNYITIALLLIVMSVSGASEFFVTGRCRALLYANQRVYICNIIQAISLFTSLIVAIIMLKLDVNIVLVQLAISLVYIVRAGALLYYVNRTYPELRGYNRVPPIAKTVSKRNDVLILTLSGLAVTGSQSLILSLLIGFEAASVYAIYNIVFSGLQSICANVNTAVTPYMGREISLHNEQKAVYIYDIIEFGFTTVVTFVFCVATFMIVPFIRLYTMGADINYIYKDFAIVFAFASMFYILKMPGNTAINAAGHFRETRTRAIAEATICIVVGVVMTLWLGQIGVLIGSVIALGWRCLDTVFYSNKHILKISSKTSLRRIGVCTAFVGVAAILAWKVDVVAASYFEWVCYACLASLISIIAILINILVLDRQTAKNIIAFVFSEKNRNKNTNAK